ncbi:inhibitor of growth protein 3 isoform X1 [Neodiprion virginianus]|uniref:inhibitor of growth protein 3 isoform X1 n=2 Tax=Neodiprion fabricii TaxID=2872261 RepID=UPI001ED96BDA|nr:inhibitor of growth protein 3 isoform X1 [Neodiprion fabricii]XP_046624550.1 inhibitor of growth protein 3 isoform X1 [Neodiprion virginianus]
MLYLEDYVEMIEHLPQELRDRFTEMREMDLGVQNSMDSLEKKVKTFFSNAKKMKPSDKEAEYETIRKDYYKTLEDADEKVHLANQMYDLVDRYLRRLDQELHKFKMELEADNKGITEILEKRSLELDQPPTNSSQKENRYSFTSTRTRDSHGHSRSEKRRDSNASSVSVEKRLVIEKSSQSLPESRPASANSGPIIATTLPSAPTAIASTVGPVNYGLGHIGAGGNAIAAAASQAIAATQQMQQGRRTASLKASYEAINTGGVHAAEFSRELAGAAQTAIAAIQETTKKHKKKVNTTVPSTSVIPAAVQQPVSPPGVTATATVTDADNTDWPYDPNEPRYCICNQVSYGDMVACDNQDCPFEWFHYPCVGISAPPKGKWYCPQCTSSMKRRGGRKN